MPFKSPLREYAVWQAMKQRCLNENNEWYKNYGGRGIEVCLKWKASFVSFLNDMGSCPKGMSIERINNDLGYAPDNCCWADKSTQSANQNKRKDNSTGYTGVYRNKVSGKYFARVQYKGVILLNKTFASIADAVKARNDYISNNNLPHKLEKSL